MPENTNEQTGIRREKEDAIKKGGVAITSHNHVEEAEMENNSTSNEVIRIEDLLATKIDNPVIRKLNRLKNVGLTDEMILNAYNDLAGSVTTESEALSVLKTIFDRYVEYISDLPNGIVLDPISGRIDYEKSHEQRLEVGILTDPFAGIDLSKKITFDDILNIDREALENNFKEYVLDYKFIMENMGWVQKWIDNDDNKKILDSEVEVDELVFSKDLNSKIVDMQERKAISIYYKDPLLFEITELELTLAKSEGTYEADLCREKLEKLYAENSSYRDKVCIRDENGNIDKEELAKFEEYKDNSQFLSIALLINDYKKKTPEQKKNLSKEDRSMLFLSTISALKYNRKRNPYHKELVSEAQEIIREFYSEFDISKCDSKAQKKIYAQILKNELGVGKLLENINITTLYNTTSDMLKMIIEENSANREKTGGIEGFDDVSSEMVNFVLKKNALKNYFIGSKIAFGKENVEAYQKLYNVLTVESWLESKDDALKMRYAALKNMKQEYESQKDNPYILGKLNEVNEQLNDFTKQYGNLGLNDTEKNEKNDAEYIYYINNMVEANIMKYYLQDAINAEKGKSYESFDEEHKKGYLRNTLLGLEYIYNNPDFCFSKMVMRRLEMMNTKDKKFITFDKDGKPVVDKNLLVKEYSSMSESKFESFEDLLQHARIKKNDYVLEKLEKYSNLEPEQFLKLDDRDNTEKSVAQIEEKRARNNYQERKIYRGKNVKVVRKSNVIPEGSKFRRLDGKPITDKEFAKIFKEESKDMDTSAIDDKQKTVDSQLEQNRSRNKDDSPLGDSKKDFADPETDNNVGSEASTSSPKNIGTVEMNAFAVIKDQALVPVSEVKKTSLFGKFVEVMKKIKNSMTSRKNKEEDRTSQVNSTSTTTSEPKVSNDNKSKSWELPNEYFTSEQQRQVAIQTKQNSVTQKEQEGQEEQSI